MLETLVYLFINASYKLMKDNNMLFVIDRMTTFVSISQSQCSDAQGSLIIPE